MSRRNTRAPEQQWNPRDQYDYTARYHRGPGRGRGIGFQNQTYGSFDGPSDPRTRSNNSHQAYRNNSANGSSGSHGGAYRSHNNYRGSYGANNNQRYFDNSGSNDKYGDEEEKPDEDDKPPKYDWSFAPGKGISEAWKDIHRDEVREYATPPPTPPLTPRSPMSPKSPRSPSPEDEKPPPPPDLHPLLLEKLKNRTHSRSPSPTGGRKRRKHRKPESESARRVRLFEEEEERQEVDEKPHGSELESSSRRSKKRRVESDEPDKVVTCFEGRPPGDDRKRVYELVCSLDRDFKKIVRENMPHMTLWCLLYNVTRTKVLSSVSFKMPEGDVKYLTTLPGQRRKRYATRVVEELISMVGEKWPDQKIRASARIGSDMFKFYSESDHWNNGNWVKEMTLDSAEFEWRKESAGDEFSADADFIMLDDDEPVITLDDEDPVSTSPVQIQLDPIPSLEDAYSSPQDSNLPLQGSLPPLERAPLEGDIVTKEIEEEYDDDLQFSPNYPEGIFAALRAAESENEKKRIYRAVFRCGAIRSLACRFSCLRMDGSSEQLQQDKERAINKEKQLINQEGIRKEKDLREMKLTKRVKLQRESVASSRVKLAEVKDMADGCMKKLEIQQKIKVEERSNLKEQKKTNKTLEQELEEKKKDLENTKQKRKEQEKKTQVKKEVRQKQLEKASKHKPKKELQFEHSELKRKQRILKMNVKELKKKADKFTKDLNKLQTKLLAEKSTFEECYEQHKKLLEQTRQKRMELQNLENSVNKDYEKAKSAIHIPDQILGGVEERIVREQDRLMKFDCSNECGLDEALVSRWEVNKTMSHHLYDDIFIGLLNQSQKSLFVYPESDPYISKKNALQDIDDMRTGADFDSAAFSLVTSGGYFILEVKLKQFLEEYKKLGNRRYTAIIAVEIDQVGSEEGHQVAFIFDLEYEKKPLVMRYDPTGEKPRPYYEELYKQLFADFHYSCWSTRHQPKKYPYEKGSKNADMRCALFVVEFLYRFAKVAELLIDSCEDRKLSRRFLRNTLTMGYPCFSEIKSPKTRNFRNEVERVAFCP